MLAGALGQLAAALERGQLGARGRVAVEITTDAGEHRPGQRLLMAASDQLARLARVGDESGLDQNRRDIRRLEDHETGLPHPALEARGDTADDAEYVLADGQAA